MLLLRCNTMGWCSQLRSQSPFKLEQEQDCEWHHEKHSHSKGKRSLQLPLAICVCTLMTSWIKMSILAGTWPITFTFGSWHWSRIWILFSTWLPFQFVNIYHAISVYVVHSKGPSEGEMVKCGNFILVASRHWPGLASVTTLKLCSCAPLVFKGLLMLIATLQGIKTGRGWK